MHIITSIKKRRLGSATACAAATGEAPSVSVAQKPTAKEMRGAEKQAEEMQESRNKLLLPLKRNCCYRFKK